MIILQNTSLLENESVDDVVNTYFQINLFLLSLENYTSRGSINCKGNVILKLKNGDTIKGFIKDGLRHGLCCVL